MTGAGKKSTARQARREAALKKKKRKRVAIFSVLGVVGLGIAAGIVFAVTRPPPEELAEVETFADMGGGHLAAGEAPPVYNSSPATSGRHAVSAVPCGIFLTEVPDEFQVHNLEHGTVVIQYQPDLSGPELQSLQNYARSKPSHIILAPRLDLSDPVVVTSWRRMLRLDSADLDTIEVYYDEYRGTGPEVGVACPFALDESA